MKKVRLTGNADAEQVLQMEAQMHQIECQKREIDEAVSAGEQALRTVNSVLEDLDDAEGWAVWDTFAGGGLISDLMKHDHLDEAQKK